MRNSNQSNSSQRRGQKNRRPGGKNGQRGGNGNRNSASNGNRNSKGSSGNQASGNNQRNSSRGRSRNEISQAWASDTTTLSSHMLTNKKNEWGNKKTESKNGNGSGSRGKNKSSNGKNRFDKSNRNQNRNKQHSRSSNGSAANKQTSDSASRGSGKQVGNIDPFELFCAYHLGITKDKGYRTANINEVANRFRSEPGMIKQALKEYDMDPESLLDRDFDMALAQLDIQVAPEGVDRLELAQGIYQDFKDAPRIKRDWKKILEEDRKENQKIFKS